MDVVVIIFYLLVLSGLTTGIESGLFFSFATLGLFISRKHAGALATRGSIDRVIKSLLCIAFNAWISTVNSLYVINFMAAVFGCVALALSWPMTPDKSIPKNPDKGCDIVVDWLILTVACVMDIMSIIHEKPIYFGLLLMLAIDECTAKKVDQHKKVDDCVRDISPHHSSKIEKFISAYGFWIEKFFLLMFFMVAASGFIWECIDKQEFAILGVGSSSSLIIILHYYAKSCC